jgi:hypothetical protein
MNEETIYAIKCRKKDGGSGKNWKFVTGNGGVNSLRIHAAQLRSKEKAEKECDFMQQANDEWEFKVVVFA